METTLCIGVTCIRICFLHAITAIYVLSTRHIYQSVLELIIAVIQPTRQQSVVKSLPGPTVLGESTGCNKIRHVALRACQARLTDKTHKERSTQHYSCSSSPFIHLLITCNGLPWTPLQSCARTQDHWNPLFCCPAKYSQKNLYPQTHTLLFHDLFHRTVFVVI